MLDYGEGLTQGDNKSFDCRGEQRFLRMVLCVPEDFL